MSPIESKSDALIALREANDEVAVLRAKLAKAVLVAEERCCPKCGLRGHDEAGCSAPIDIRGSGRSA